MSKRGRPHITLPWKVGAQGALSWGRAERTAGWDLGRESPGARVHLPNPRPQAPGGSSPGSKVGAGGAGAGGGGAGTRLQKPVSMLRVLRVTCSSSPDT